MSEASVPVVIEPRPGKYRHYKGGEYEVQGVATHSETAEQLVVYRPLYGEGALWVRPLSMFLESVEHEGVEQLRFAYIEV
ncbi:MAG: hypothetical protein ACI9JM_000782 [Halioglobus sp.]|jgi:hypothetical protein